MKSHINDDSAWGSSAKNSGVDPSWYGTEQRLDHMPRQPEKQESAESAQGRKAFRLPPLNFNLLKLPISKWGLFLENSIKTGSQIQVQAV